MLRIVLVAVIMFSVLLPVDVFCITADVEDISDRDYLEPALKAINSAKESIYMVMYLISYMPGEKDTPVYKLLCALRNAHNRGVKVKVILDFRSSKDVEGQVGYYAYKFLKDAGIEVRFDTVGVCTHNKTIIVDERVIVAGSANWSGAAIEKNNETNFYIESPEIARSLLKRIKGIKLIHKAPEKGEKEEGVLVPLCLMHKDSVFQDMMRRHDERSFDIYLLLLSRFKPGQDGKVDITYEEIRDGIGMKRKDYRDMLNRTLKKLQDRYKLIKLDIGYNKPVNIIMLEPGAKSPMKHLKPEGCINIPLGYWSYNWSNRLTMNAKYCLLINLAEVSTQTKWNEWMLTRGQAEEKYGICALTISRGMDELRKYRIIDIEYSEIDKGYEQRMPAKTRFLGLYGWGEFQKELKQLEEKFGKEKVEKVREYADVVYRAYDLEAIEDIIGFIDTYGEEDVARAFHKVVQKNIDNPKRSFKYVIGILKNR